MIELLPDPAVIGRAAGLVLPTNAAPPRDLVETVLPAAVVVVDEMAAVPAATRAAVAAFRAVCRGGARWDEAVRADREAAAAGGQVQALATVVRDQVDAYALVAAMVGSEDARAASVRERRAALLAELAAAARAAVPDLVEELGGCARLAWLERRRGPGRMAFEGGCELLDRIAGLQALAWWADGSDPVFSVGTPAVTLDPETLGFWIAAANVHTGRQDPRLWEADDTVIVPADWSTDEFTDMSDARAGSRVVRTAVVAGRR